jgi:hypothetical protein
MKLVWHGERRCRKPKASDDSCRASHSRAPRVMGSWADRVLPKAVWESPLEVRAITSGAAARETRKPSPRHSQT